VAAGPALLSGAGRISFGQLALDFPLSGHQGRLGAKYTIMPLFEYECRGCGHRFEHLTRGDRTPSCPSCESVDLQKLLSVFAVSASGPAGPSRESFGGCGTCGDPRGPGSCGIN
jgi:putative FmdB family regulatory protein